jgi:protein-tyrosine-phosphatase
MTAANVIATSIRSHRALESADYLVTLTRDDIRSICATMVERSGFWARTADAEDSSDPDSLRHLSSKCLAIAEKMAAILEKDL